jgi:type IV pilus assembly protein PilX
MSSRAPTRQAGFAMIACALILMAVLLLSLAVEQNVRQSANAAANALDRQLARQAAEAALLDAEQDILQSRDVTVAISQPALSYGSVTGNRFAVGGRLQASQLPTYAFSMQPLAQQETSAVRYFFRITAIGFGSRVTTQVVMQSDFLKSSCTTCLNPWQGRLGWRELVSP